jgi:hypothetical protein
MVIASTIFLRPYQLSKEGFVLSIIIVPSNVSLHGHSAMPNIRIQRLREEKNKRRRETVSSDLRQCFRKSAAVTSANLRQSQQGHEWRFARPSVDLNKPDCFQLPQSASLGVWFNTKLGQFRIRYRDSLALSLPSSVDQPRPHHRLLAV